MNNENYGQILTRNDEKFIMRNEENFLRSDFSNLEFVKKYTSDQAKLYIELEN